MLFNFSYSYSSMNKENESKKIKSLADNQKIEGKRGTKVYFQVPSPNCLKTKKRVPLLKR